MTRLPENYEFKENTGTSNYLKVTEDPQEFRILTSPVIWWEYFRAEWDKALPVRQKAEFDWIPSDSKNWEKPKEFWAFAVWNHTLGKVQIMEITQQTIKKEILKYAQDDENWGDPKKYDLRISKSGKGKETKYTVTALPKSKFESEADEKWAFELAKPINLEALFDGSDPFKPF